MAVDTGGVAAAPAEARPLWNGRRPEIVAAVRTCVRGLLEQNDAFATADPDTRRAVAQKMVKVALAGADLAAQDVELSQAIAEASAARPAPMATAQTASEQMGMAATRAAGGTIQALKTAIDFPGFVTSLINGVFQAITSSSITQLTALSDLLDNVSTSAESFTEQNIRDEEVVSWAASKFPFFVREQDGLAVREGTDLTTQGRTLREGLGATESEVSSIDESDLVGTLGPLVKRKMGRDRQQILGTLVQMGLQRIVVDEGRLHASMDMRVDTRSVSEEDKRSRSEFGVEAKASGSFGVGAWGASASVGTNYSQVQSDAQYTKEEIDTRAGLRSSVDLAFRTEQVPLDRMADKNARVRLDLNARVPASVSEGSSLISSESHVGEVAAPQRPAATPPAQQPAQQPPAGQPPRSGQQPPAGQPSRPGQQPPGGQPPRSGQQPPAGQPSRPGQQPPAGQPSRSGQQPPPAQQQRPAQQPQQQPGQQQQQQPPAQQQQQQQPAQQQQQPAQQQQQQQPAQEART